VEIHRRVIQSLRAVVSETPEPSVERTSFGRLRLAPAAAHVER